MREEADLGPELGGQIKTLELGPDEGHEESRGFSTQQLLKRIL